MDSGCFCCHSHWFGGSIAISSFFVYRYVAVIAVVAVVVVVVVAVALVAIVAAVPFVL